MTGFWRVFRGDRLACIAFWILAVFILAGLCAPWIAPYDPYHMDPAGLLKPPSIAHWLGTDRFGRDILSRILHGARISLKVGGVSVGIALLAGTALGVLAGFFRRRLDWIISRLLDVMLSFPEVLLALTAIAVLGPSLNNMMLAIGIVYTPLFARITRASTLSLREAPFVEAARAEGSGSGRIIARHILPNAFAPLIVQTSLSFAFACLAEATLSFLGFGVEPDVPSWGIMLSEGKDWMESAWWVAVFPGAAITLVVLSFHLIGDGLRSALDPRES